MVEIWIELEMRLSMSPWLGLLCTYTGRVRYEPAVQVQLQPQLNSH